MGVTPAIAQDTAGLHSGQHPQLRHCGIAFLSPPAPRIAVTLYGLEPRRFRMTYTSNTGVEKRALDSGYFRRPRSKPLGGSHRGWLPGLGPLIRRLIPSPNAHHFGHRLPNRTFGGSEVATNPYRRDVRSGPVLDLQGLILAQAVEDAPTAPYKQIASVARRHQIDSDRRPDAAHMDK